MPKFKRCKITRPQLNILMQHFEDDPLPSFEKRQSIATRLGMTPRSVQIWFQNRRQRLLKPLRQGVVDDETSLHSSMDCPYSGSTADCSLSGECSSESGDGFVAFAEASAVEIAEGSQLPRNPQLLPPAAALTAPRLHETVSIANLAASFSPQLPANFSMPLQNMPTQDNIRGCSPHLLLMLQKALVERQLPPGVAALLAQTLQHQISGRQVPEAQPQLAANAQSAVQTLTSPPLEQLLAPGGVHAAARQGSGSSSRESAATTEGVDGLLLLSACADAQRPAAPAMQQAAMPMTMPAMAASPTAAYMASAMMGSQMPMHTKSANSTMMHSVLSGSMASFMAPTMAIA